MLEMKITKCYIMDQSSLQNLTDDLTFTGYAFKTGIGYGGADAATISLQEQQPAWGIITCSKDPRGRILIKVAT
jgi:hypothetical protein